MTVHLEPASTLDVAALASLFNEAFADYLIRFPAMTPEHFRRFLTTQGIDLELSRLARIGNERVGFGFIHAEGGLCRLAGMGVVPSGRQRGAASTLLDALLRDAVDRGDRLMTLEVFEQNARALALYQSREFQPRVRLHGWKRDGVATQPLLPRVEVGTRLEPISLADLATALPCAASALEMGTIPKSDGDPDSESWWEAFRYPTLPWQISLSAAHVLPASARAFGTGDAVAVVLEPEPGTLRWCTLLPLRKLEDPWTSLRATAARVLGEFPTHRWVVSPVFPEIYGTRIFGPLGFQLEPLNQWHMHRDLRAVQQSK
ncbi:MAG: GNAT family N-acetyltransferase [Verrucomicrobiales bacterium]|nr:GNAT family N-acetyltransferase [Verrucomicrobiales bacterium]